MKDLDGLEQNLHKMAEAERRLRDNERVKESRRLFKESTLFSLGKDNYFHRWLDTHTEIARAEPYYYVHWMLYYRVGPLLGFTGGMVGALLWSLL